MFYMTADVHLVSRVWVNRPELAGDAFRAWSRFCAAVIADPVPKTKTVLIAGDLFDAAEVDGQVLESFTAGVDALYSAGIPLVFTQGNHDLNPVPVASVQGATWLAGRVLELEGIQVAGLDYLPGETLKRHTFPECDLLLMHATFAHVVRSEIAADLSMADIPEQVGNILVGDIHIRDCRVFARDMINDANERWCLSPGPLHPLDISQAGPHGYWTWEPGTATLPQFCPIPGRQILRYTIEKADDLAEVAETLRRDYSGLSPDLRPLVELRHPPAISVDVALFHEAHRQEAVFFNKLSESGRLGLEPETLKALRVQMKTLTLQQALNRVIAADKEPDVFAFLQGVLDPASDVKQLVEQELAQCGCLI